MGSRQPTASRRRGGWQLNVVLALLVAGALVVGPRLVDAYAALEWVRYQTAKGPAQKRAGEQADKVGRSAARAIERAAPLPVAGQAARLALDLGRNIEPRDPAAAVLLFLHVHGALEKVRASAWRGLGLGPLTEEAAALEQRARARMQDMAAAPAPKKP